MMARRKSREAAVERRGDGTGADQATSMAASDLAYAGKGEPKTPPAAPQKT
jgi:hypothetical protein